MQKLIDALLDQWKLHRNFWILASFSHATEDLINLKDKNTKYKYLVYNIQIIPYTTLSKAAVTRLKFFNLPYINIIQIKDYLKTQEGRPLIWEYTDDSTDKNWIRIAQYSYPDFFNVKILDFFFLNLGHLDRTYFLFHSSLWLVILSYFRHNNYILSGGSLQNRGIHTDLQKRVSRFLEIYELECPRGFHGKLSPILKPNIDFKSKSGKEQYEQMKQWIMKDYEDKNITSSDNIQNKNKSDNLTDSNRDTPFGIKGQNRKFHVSPNIRASVTTVTPTNPDWQYYEYKLTDNTLTQFDLERSVISFYEQELAAVSDSTSLLLQFKLRLIDDTEENISFVLKFYVEETIRMMTLLNGFYSLKNLADKSRASHILYQYKFLSPEDNSDKLVLSLNKDANLYKFYQNIKISKYLERLNYTPITAKRNNSIKWRILSFILEEGVLTDSQLERATYNFFSTLLEKWVGERYALIQFKLRLSNNKYLDISFVLKFYNTEYNELKYLFVEFLSLKRHLIKDEKDNLKATHIIFKYAFTTSDLNEPDTDTPKKEYSTHVKINHQQKNKSLTCTHIFNFTLPCFNKQMRNFSSIATKQSIYDIDSPIVKDLLKIMITEPMNNDTQLIIERYLRNQYRESLLIKLKQESDKVKPLNYNILTASLNNVLLEHTKNLQKMIANYKSSTIVKAKTDKINLKLIQDVVLTSPDDFLISVMFGRLLRIFSNNNRLNENTYSTNVYIDLGKELIDKYISDLYKTFLSIEDHAKYTLSLRYPLSQWKKDNEELMDTLNDNIFQLNVGSLLVGWMKVLGLLDNKVVTVSKIEKRNIVVIGKKLEKVLPKDLNKVPLLNLPNRIPMIVQPKPYSRDANKNAEVLGGYLLNDIEYTDNIILENWKLAKNSLVLKENIIYDTVNYTSSVAFKINTRVLDFILENNQIYNFIIDPDFIHPLSLKDKLRKNEKIQLESFYSRRDLEKNILGLAEIFRKAPKFYMPVRLDYRGRINVMCEYLKYQGSELAKALLLFAEGEKVNVLDKLSINYLKIFGANCFGNKIKKLSFADRIKWVDDNIQNIINFENGILISKAEDKLLFISFCFEFNNYLHTLKNNLPYFTTYLPVEMDASCNGFQHLSMLIGDQSLIKELNLAPSSSTDKPKDFYTFVALKVIDFLENELKRTDLEPKVRESYLRLYKLDIAGQRKLVKKALMTLPYNATPRSIVKYIKENFDKIEEDHYVLIDDNNVVFKEIDFSCLRNALHIVLYKEFPKLKRLLNYFKEIAKISNELEIPVPWNLPSGFGVQQQYYATKKIKAKPYIYTKELLNINSLDKNNYDNKKQFIALMPNVIHSLDASSLALLINNYFKENSSNSFYSIHDCFAVTCNNVQRIMNLLKIIYFNIYSKDRYLLEFDKDFLNSILKHYGENCYDSESRIITIESKNNKKKIIELHYPNVLEVIANDKLNFEGSSYVIH